MFKKSLLLLLVVSMPLSAYKKIDEYSDESKWFMTKCTIASALVTAAGPGFVIGWILLDSYSNNNEILNTEQGIGVGVIAAIGLIGGKIGRTVSSYFVKEERFNTIQKWIESDDVKQTIRILSCSDDIDKVQKEAEKVLVSWIFPPRINLARKVNFLLRDAEGAYYYLARIVEKERKLKTPNEYLIQQGTEYLDTLLKYITITLKKWPLVQIL